MLLNLAVPKRLLKLTNIKVEMLKSIAKQLTMFTGRPCGDISLTMA